MKVCSRCKDTKPFSAFYPREDGRHGRRGTCRECMRSNEQAYRERHRHRRPDVALKSIYGLTRDEYNAILAGQGGGCAICGGTLRLCVDHCHATDKIRGILCNDCNLILGHAKDSPAQLAAAIKYLEKHNEPKD